MAYKSKYSKRSWKRKSRRGKYGRKSFRSRVQKVIAKNLETKFYDTGAENVQLYHDVGLVCSAGAYGAFVFDPWSSIGKGTSVFQRLGDQITPVGMSLRLWIGNKSAHPNVMYRLLVCSIKRVYNGVITTATNINPFYSVVNNGMICPPDMEKCSRIYYDKIFNLQLGASNNGIGPVEGHMQKKIWIGRRRRGRSIKFDTNGAIMNNPLSVYLIPYDSYGSLITDQVGSFAWTMRLYWKDG